MNRKFGFSTKLILRFIFLYYFSWRGSAVMCSLFFANIRIIFKIISLFLSDKNVVFPWIRIFKPFNHRIYN